MSQRFYGIFAGERFRGTFTGRDGQIVFVEDDYQLEIYWELGAKGVIIGSIPFKWKTPPEATLTRQHQLEIFNSLMAWLRANNVPNDLTSEPWLNAPDETDTLCAWARCENARVLGYAICRDHIRRGYLQTPLDSPPGLT
jgi:hypothetical protein